LGIGFNGDNLAQANGDNCFTFGDLLEGCTQGFCIVGGSLANTDLGHSSCFCTLEKNKFYDRGEKISAHADGGPRSQVFARETLRSAPHRRERKFSAARVCRITFKHLPQPLRSHIQTFGTIGQLLKFSKKNLKMPPLLFL
jgi:hypothetical protein